MTHDNEHDDEGYDLSEAGGFRLGDVVVWDGGEGRIEHLMAEGYLGMKGSPFAIRASRDDPAALLRVYRNGQPTEYLVGKPVSVLSRSRGTVLGNNGRR